MITNKKFLKTIIVLLFLAITASIYGESSLSSKIFTQRHSGTFYNPTLCVDDEQINTIIESTRWTPSSYNDQPWVFIICDRDKTPEAYNKALNSIYGSQQEWVQNAPILVIVISRKNFRYNNKPNDWAEYDTGAAALSMSLQATDLGLMAHQIGGFDKDEICEQFQLSKDYKPMALMTLGYEIEDVESEGRERLPVEENFFQAEIGNSFQSHSTTDN